MTPLRSAIYVGHVMHQRTRPKAHRLRYRVLYMALDLEELAEVDSRLRFFSLNRRNLFSLDVRDYGDGSGAPLQAQVRDALRLAGLAADGRIMLVTIPRTLGYAFNPLSVYYCFHVNGDLAATIYEVNNTFGQRHSYVVPAQPGASGLIRQESGKSLYVSPFLETDMRYEFLVAAPDHRLRLSVTALDCEGPVLFAKLTAAREPLTDSALLRSFATHPLFNLKVIAGIHWEALRLWLKGVRPTERPRQATGGYTLGAASAATRRQAKLRVIS